MHRGERVVMKQGRFGSIYHMNDVSGGYRRRWGPTTNTSKQAEYM